MLLSTLFLYPLARPLVDRADSIGYVSPAISLITDGDLLYLDEHRELGMNEVFFRPTPAGLVGNHWDIGLGLALLPAYALEAATGEPGRALVRYERAFALGVGLGQRSLTSYLGLSVAHEGVPAARERLARLERRFAGHPALAAARQELDRGR